MGLLTGVVCLHTSGVDFVCVKSGVKALLFMMKMHPS